MSRRAHRSNQALHLRHGGNLYATYNYADARGIASVLHPLEAGHYTVAVVINADEEAAETSTLTALHEWLEIEMSHETNLLSGIAEVNVTEDGISPVTVFLQRGCFHAVHAPSAAHAARPETAGLHTREEQDSCRRNRQYNKVCGRTLQGRHGHRGASQSRDTRPAS